MLSSLASWPQHLLLTQFSEYKLLFHGLRREQDSVLAGDKLLFHGLRHRAGADQGFVPQVPPEVVFQQPREFLAACILGPTGAIRALSALDDFSIAAY
jgi:hypothetical protein